MRYTLKKIVTYSAIILILPCIIFIFIFIYFKFQLKNLIIISNKSSIVGLTQLNGVNLLPLNIKKVSLNLQKLNSSFLTINLSKKFPNSLILETKNRIAIAKIQVGNGYKFVDLNGFIFTDNDNIADLPVIIIPQISIYSDQKTDWRVTKAISFIAEATRQGISIEQLLGDNTDNSFTIKLSIGPEIMLPYSADAVSKASSLQVIILRFRIEGKNIAKIDFRFDKPVVTLSNGEKISSTF